MFRPLDSVCAARETDSGTKPRWSPAISNQRTILQYQRWLKSRSDAMTLVFVNPASSPSFPSGLRRCPRHSHKAHSARGGIAVPTPRRTKHRHTHRARKCNPLKDVRKSNDRSRTRSCFPALPSTASCLRYYLISKAVSRELTIRILPSPRSARFAIPDDRPELAQFSPMFGIRAPIMIKVSRFA
jgi:hypothetical protein